MNGQIRNVPKHGQNSPVVKKLFGKKITLSTNHSHLWVEMCYLSHNLFLSKTLHIFPLLLNKIKINKNKNKLKIQQSTSATRYSTQPLNKANLPIYPKLLLTLPVMLYNAIL